MIDAVKELWKFDKCWSKKHWKGLLAWCENEELRTFKAYTSDNKYSLSLLSEKIRIHFLFHASK